MSAYTAYSVGQFLALAPAQIFADLARGDSISGFTQLSALQQQAWREQIALLRSVLSAIVASHPHAASAGLVFEYRIPRRELRVDAVLLLPSTAIVIEFKVGASAPSAAAVAQLEDYVLDLTYYHEASRALRLIPVLCATEAAGERDQRIKTGGGLEPIHFLGPSGMERFLRDLLAAPSTSGELNVDTGAWIGSPYRPIPTIVEATVAMFANHRVDEINNAMSERRTLDATIDRVATVVAGARLSGTKHLCVITGVPGAGKTLAGLRIAHDPRVSDAQNPAAFLSGNGPLLAVLKTALSNDFCHRQKMRRVDADKIAQGRLQSVHAYLHHEDGAKRPPTERLLVFDEAQRAWSAEKLQKMAARRRAASGESEEARPIEALSEPERLLRILSRQQGGAVLVALCGNGQEIHDGEAGVQSWVSAAARAAEPWQLHISPVARGTSKASSKSSPEPTTIHLQSDEQIIAGKNAVVIVPLGRQR